MKTFNQQLLNTGIGTQQSVMSIEKIYVIIQTLTLSYDHLNPKLYIYNYFITLQKSHKWNKINIYTFYCTSTSQLYKNYIKNNTAWKNTVGIDIGT